MRACTKGRSHFELPLWKAMDIRVFPMCGTPFHVELVGTVQPTIQGPLSPKKLQLAKENNGTRHEIFANPYW